MEHGLHNKRTLNRMRSIRGGAEFNFYYDICGNVTAWQDLGREIDMTYDAFDRLKTEYIYDGTAIRTHRADGNPAGITC